MMCLAITEFYYCCLLLLSDTIVILYFKSPQEQLFAMIYFLFTKFISYIFVITRATRVVNYLKHTR